MAGTLKFNPEDMTMGDLADFEEQAGQPFYDVFGKDAINGSEVHVPAKALVVLTWIIYRHGDPAFTLEDARNVKITDLQLEVEETPPANGAGSPS